LYRPAFSGPVDPNSKLVMKREYPPARLDRHRETYNCCREKRSGNTWL
jgi:hypothetical protein